MLSILEEVYPDVDGKCNKLIGTEKAGYNKSYYTTNYFSAL